MNENLKASYVETLLMDYEKGPSDGSVPLSENGAALAPYVCPGGELTIGYGDTKWFDGEDVQQFHRLSGEEEALALLRKNLPYYEDGVRKLLTREATPWQFSGMVALAYNIGLSAFEGSSVLTSFNAGRMEDAATNFGKWTGATCDRPPKWLRDKPEIFAAYIAAGKVGEDHKRNIRWIGPDGQYCRYMLRYEGLLNRHFAEALMFMGKDHRPTLRGPTPIDLSLTPTHPSKAQWNPTKGRWEDGVEDKTSFKVALEHAWYNQLPAPELVLTTKAEPAPSVAQGKAGQPELAPQPKAPAAPASKPAATSGPAAGPVAAPSAPQVPQKPLPVPASTKPPEPVTIPPSVQVSTQSDMGPTTRTMWVSKRFWGGVLIIAGRLIIVADIGGHFAPAVKSFIGDGILMDWMTGVIVTMIGELVLDRGEKKATGPMDTPKRIALTTPTP